MLTVDYNGAHFDYAVCDHKGLFGNCTHTHMVRDTYDLKDPATLKTLASMDMVIMVRPKPVQ